MKEQTLVQDSLHATRRLEAWLAPVPGSRVSLQLPFDSVRRLPAGASFTAREGQATLEVSINKEGNLQVESTCDSLVRRCIILETELTQLNSRKQEKKETPPPMVIREPTGWQWFWIHTGRILSVILTLSVVGRVIKRRLNG